MRVTDRPHPVRVSPRFRACPYSCRSRRRPNAYTVRAFSSATFVLLARLCFRRSALCARSAAGRAAFRAAGLRFRPRRTAALRLRLRFCLRLALFVRFFHVSHLLFSLFVIEW